MLSKHAELGGIYMQGFYSERVSICELINIFINYECERQ
jgi:hypothetical protein